TTWSYDPAGDVTAVTKPGGLVTAQSYDDALRPRDTVRGADSVSAASAGLVDAKGGVNARTRVLYDADGHAVARFSPRAFTSSTTTPVASFMLRTDFDVDGRPTAQYVPRYDTASGSDLGL